MVSALMEPSQIMVLEAFEGQDPNTLVDEVYKANQYDFLGEVDDGKSEYQHKMGVRRGGSDR